jgi:CSLREA domain-containing protein
VRRPALSIVVIVVAATVLASKPAWATAGTIHVTTTHDVVADDGKCSLREAITAANTNSASGSKHGECPAGSPTDLDKIVLRSHSTYVLSLAGDDDTNAAGDLDISSDLTLKGGHGTTILQKARSRVIDVLSHSVNLEHLKITGGHAADGDPSGVLTGAFGGGVRDAGLIFMNNCVVTGNRAGAGAVSASTGVTGGSGGDGGGIDVESAGTLNMSHDVVSHNAAGAGAEGASTISTLNPPGPGGSGGGIFAAGNLFANTIKVIHNTAGAGGDGHGDAFGSRSPGADGGGGGGIASDHALSLGRSVLSRNHAGDGGNGGSSSGAIPSVGANGGAGGSGGGLIASGALTVETTTFSANRAGNGGAGGVGAPSVSGSGADGGAGGIGGEGGGLETTATTTFGSSTVSGNSAGKGGEGGAGGAGSPDGTPGAPGNEGDGGGMAVDSGLAGAKNSTFNGNRGLFGGGIYNDGATFSLNDVTVTRNHANEEGGGLYADSGSFSVANTIVASNIADVGGTECKGPFTDDGYNLIQNLTPDCPGFTQTSDVVGKNPKLGPLAANGGPTKTDALLKHSPAIRAGNPATPGSGSGACEAQDQRGVTRHICDIGAFQRSK